MAPPRLGLRAIVLRILAAAAATAPVMAVACAALFVTETPRVVSLLVEPLSLLLLPGLLFDLVRSGAHDLAPTLILRVDAVFYFLLFFLLSLRYPRPHTPSL